MAAAHQSVSGGSGFEFSPQFLFWATKTGGIDPRPASDGTRIEYAVDSVATRGVCLEPKWIYDGRVIRGNVTHATTSPPPPQPSSTAQRDALAFRRQHRIHPYTTAAQQVWSILAGGGLAVVSLPVVQLGSRSRAVSNWTTPLSLKKGHVTDPPPSRMPAVVRSAHAVCVTGFVADPVEPCGGYFVFRNSWGPRWAWDLPDPAYPQQIPGYGRVSASFVDRWLIELAEIR